MTLSLPFKPLTVQCKKHDSAISIKTSKKPKEMPHQHFLILSLLLITYIKKPLRRKRCCIISKTSVVVFPLSLFVDDVDNEPPVLLESCNISPSISSAGAMGIKSSVLYERTKRSGRFLAHLLNLHTAQFYLFLFFSKLSVPHFSNLQIFSGSSEAEACYVFQ